MIIEELIKRLQKEDPKRIVVLHEYKEEKGSVFYDLIPSATPLAKSKNLFVLIDNGTIEPER